MSGIELTLRHEYRGLLDASRLIPENLLQMNTADIERTSLDVSGKPYVVGDLFSVMTIEDDVLVIQGPVTSSCRWGQTMASGRLLIECDVGDEVGIAMRGGSVEIRGSVGNYLASGMRGGRIKVCGNVGDFTGNPTLGERRGMRGGLVTIMGNAGERTGDCLRRGTLIIHGNVGDYCGARMIAGTIAVGGSLGKFAATMMRRGTLWAPHLKEESLTTTFTQPQRVTVPHLALWYRWLAKEDEQFREWAQREPMAIRWLGDLAVQGLGEVLSPPL